MKQITSIFNRYLFTGLLAGLLVAVPVGFALGVYFLPIIVASEGATEIQISTAKENTLASASFVKDLKGSDSMHWGEGELLISKEDGQVYATLDGEVAPGPDYKIYLTSKFVDDKDSFLAIKEDSQKVSEVNGFKNFRTMLPASTKVNDYTAVVIWCERFEKFITAGKLNIEG